MLSAIRWSLCATLACISSCNPGALTPGCCAAETGASRPAARWRATWRPATPSWSSTAAPSPAPPTGARVWAQGQPLPAPGWRTAFPTRWCSRRCAAPRRPQPPARMAALLTSCVGHQPNARGPGVSFCLIMTAACATMMCTHGAGVPETVQCLCQHRTLSLSGLQTLQAHAAGGRVFGVLAGRQ